MQYILIFIVISAVTAAGYTAVSSYNNAIEDAQTAKANTARALDANLSLEIALVNKEHAIKYEMEERLRVENDFKKSRQDVKKLEGMFKNHDFSNLYDKKPGLILKRVNAGTLRVFGDYASAINDQIIPNKNKDTVPTATKN